MNINLNFIARPPRFQLKLYTQNREDEKRNIHFCTIRALLLWCNFFFFRSLRSLSRSFRQLFFSIPYRRCWKRFSFEITQFLTINIIDQSLFCCFRCFLISFENRKFWFYFTFHSRHDTIFFFLYFARLLLRLNRFVFSAFGNFYSYILFVWYQTHTREKPILFQPIFIDWHSFGVHNSPIHINTNKFSVEIQLI